MPEVVKGPWPARQRNAGDGKTHKQVMEDYWRNGEMRNPLHLNRPSVMVGHEASQPTLFLDQGDIVTDGGVARANMLNFIKQCRKENT